MDNFDEDFDEDFDDEAMFIVDDFDGYMDGVVDAVAETLQIQNVKEITDLCPKSQIKSFVMENSEMSEDDELLITTSNFQATVNAVLQRVQNISIAQLAAEGFLDCAWDEELNDMVFWLSEKGSSES